MLSPVKYTWFISFSHYQLNVVNPVRFTKVKKLFNWYLYIRTGKTLKF